MKEIIKLNNPIYKNKVIITTTNKDIFIKIVNKIEKRKID